MLEKKNFLGRESYFSTFSFKISYKKLCAKKDLNFPLVPKFPSKHTYFPVNTQISRGKNLPAPHLFPPRHFVNNATFYAKKKE